mgnify:CR=1 FL=1
MRIGHSLGLLRHWLKLNGLDSYDLGLDRLELFRKRLSHWLRMLHRVREDVSDDLVKHPALHVLWRVAATAASLSIWIENFSVGLLGDFPPGFLNCLVRVSSVFSCRPSGFANHLGAHQAHCFSKAENLAVG